MRPPNQPPRNARRNPRQSSKNHPELAAAKLPKAGRARSGNWLYGRHAVAAALANPRRRWHRLAVLPGEERDAAALVAAARARQVGDAERLEVLGRAEFNQLLPEGAVHQGWALSVEPLPAPELEAVLRNAAERQQRTVILVLDQVTDPHNVGAILRSAAAFGAAAVIIADHNAPPVTGVLAKAASGALETVPLVRAVNLSRALDRLKEAGFWSCGLDEDAPAGLASLDLGRRVALLLGSEGGGLRRLLREHCDYLARLPTRPELPSLNVSNAAAVALYELTRAEPLP